MLTTEFDMIFLINLPAQKEKLARSSAELIKHNINFEVIPAISDNDGAKGLFLTMRTLFENCIKSDLNRILVFEDDIKFVQDPQYYLPWMMDQLEEIDPYWDIFYLGPNTHRKLYKAGENVLHAYNCRSTHAVAYSLKGMHAALSNMKFFHEPIDVVFETRIQPMGNCYCAYPMLATQCNGWSDIEKKEVDQSYIETRFAENTKHLVTP